MYVKGRFHISVLPDPNKAGILPFTAEQNKVEIKESGFIAMKSTL